jgi:putative phosphoribosyl transferase
MSPAPEPRGGERRDVRIAAGDVVLDADGGHPDLADTALPAVRAPTLLIVGGHDVPVIRMNEEALAQLHADKRLAIVPGASHLFEEPGTLDAAATLAVQWFLRYLVAEAAPGPQASNRKA